MTSRLLAELPPHDSPDLWAAAASAERLVDELGLDVPCALTPAIRQQLHRLLRAMNARSVLDIGTYCGTSALVFAHAVGDTGRVITVDREDVNAAGAYWSRIPGGKRPRQLLEEAGLERRVEFVTMDSADFMRSTEHRFDFISIDGWHEAYHVYADILLALGLVKRGGLIFLDDVQIPAAPIEPGRDEIPGPHQALQWHRVRGSQFRVQHDYGRAIAFLLSA